MNLSNPSTNFPTLVTIALLAVAWGLLLTELHAGEQQDPRHNALVVQRVFVSPEQAIGSLRAAVEAKDDDALGAIFGPEFRGLLSGDEARDAKHERRFATALSQGCKAVNEGEDRITFEVGTNNWPMPIPLVRTDGQWHFDTAAGKQEIINRHIGKNELHAIGVCRAYVAAQRLHASMNQDAGRGVQYAQRFSSAPGQKDGLFWPATAGEPASPFGPLVAAAQVTREVVSGAGGPQPFHGYLFRILTRQGPAAPGGKMNAMHDGLLTGGFALVAYPAQWDSSGIMTFIVNQDGMIFQRNLGAATCRRAAAMDTYNPDREWTQVLEPGQVGAASER